MKGEFDIFMTQLPYWGNLDERRNIIPGDKNGRNSTKIK